MAVKNPEHYVDNKEFLRHMIEFKENTQVARDNGEDDPRIPDVLGEIFVKIATTETLQIRRYGLEPFL